MRTRRCGRLASEMWGGEFVVAVLLLVVDELDGLRVRKVALLLLFAVAAERLAELTLVRLFKGVCDPLGVAAAELPELTSRNGYDDVAVLAEGALASPSCT